MIISANSFGQDDCNSAIHLQDEDLQSIYSGNRELWFSSNSYSDTMIFIFSTNYNQNVFTEIVNLIPYAYEIKKLTALCNKCIAENKNRIKNNAKNNETENIESGNIINMAPVTVRLSDNKERLVVGQEEVYSVSCLKHLFKE